MIRYETQRWALNFSLETIIQQNLFNFLKLRLIKLFNQIHNNIIKTWQVFCDLWWYLSAKPNRTAITRGWFVVIFLSSDVYIIWVLMIYVWFLVPNTLCYSEFVHIITQSKLVQKLTCHWRCAATKVKQIWIFGQIDELIVFARFQL